MSGKDAAGRAGSEILFEFQRVGAYMKVTAIDAATATEVSVAGPASGSTELLKRTAIAKLQFVLKRDAAKAGPGR